MFGCSRRKSRTASGVARGVIRHLPDIQAFIAGEHQRQVGNDRLAKRRRDKALLMLAAMLDATGCTRGS